MYLYVHPSEAVDMGPVRFVMVALLEGTAAV